MAEWTVVPTRVLLSCSGMALWTLIYLFVLSWIQEAHAQHALYDSLRQQLAAGTAPIGGAIRPGRPVALLTIPAAHVDRVVVVEGTTSAILRDGPGHLRTTALPGQAGASVIYGRSTMFGAPFADIDNLQTGDDISLTTGQGVAHYTVTDVRHDGDPLPPTLATNAGRLVLITATGGGWRNGWAPNTAVSVDAALTTPVQPTPTGRPEALAPPERQLATDATEHTYIQIVLWLQAALIAAGGFAWAWHRWNRWQLWLGGVPILLAILWSLSSVTVPLLPNLL